MTVHSSHSPSASVGSAIDCVFPRLPDLERAVCPDQVSGFHLKAWLGQTGMSGRMTVRPSVSDLAGVNRSEGFANAALTSSFEDEKTCNPPEASHALQTVAVHNLQGQPSTVPAPLGSLRQVPFRDICRAESNSSDSARPLPTPTRAACSNPAVRVGGGVEMIGRRSHSNNRSPGSPAVLAPGQLTKRLHSPSAESGLAAERAVGRHDGNIGQRPVLRCPIISASSGYSNDDVRPAPIREDGDAVELCCGPNDRARRHWSNWAPVCSGGNRAAAIQIAQGDAQGRGVLDMGQAKVVTSDAVDATDHLLEVGRRIMADGQITPSEQSEWNIAADDCHGKVITVHWRFRLLRMFTSNVQDIRNIEETAARNGISNGLRLLDSPSMPLDAA